MSDATTQTDTPAGPMLAADGTPLKQSLARALRRQKIRALMLIAPLLLFILFTFIIPIGQMLMRSVENDIVSGTLPRTTAALETWDAATGEAPGEATFRALYQDMAIATQLKQHTRLGSRLNYEQTGMSSLFRKTGREMEDLGEHYLDQFEDVEGDFAPDWDQAELWAPLMASDDWIASRAAWADAGENGAEPRFEADPAVAEALPATAAVYAEFARFVRSEGDSLLDEDPWPLVFTTLYEDLSANPDAVSALPEDQRARFQAAAAALPAFEPLSFRDTFIDIEEDWAAVETWETIQVFSPTVTPGYFLAAVDRELTPDGIAQVPEDERIYSTLFVRTMVMSLIITGSCILLGYPVAWLLANLPLRTANVLMILVLLPFWTSLLVRTSAWKVLLQQQGVINDLLVWLNILDDAGRLIMINNQTGTIIAMTHILLPFMILPLYSVMATIPPTYLRAAKSLGATNWTAFWRVYFPQSVPGIGAGSILVFILAIGYYITPEIVGGTKGVFISNRIAYHISSSLNWGLAAALGTILLALVLALYWLYDRIVGIDNVKLGG